MKRALVLVLAAGMAGTTLGQVSNWNNPAGGTWHVASNWDTNNIPDNASESAALVNLSTPYAVTLTTGTTIANLFTVFDTTLNMQTSTSLSVSGATFSNLGTVVVNSNGGGGATSITFSGGASLTGAGSIRLNATSGVLDRAYLTSSGGFTNGNGHTIRGRGNIYNAMVNNGVIVADETGSVLQTLSGAKTNNSFMRATNGGILQINGGSINQSGGGAIQADNGTVSIVGGATIVSGSIGAINGGLVEVGGATFNASAVTGPLSVLNSATLSLPTGIANNGVITVNPAGGGNVTVVSLADGQLISGNGQIVLNATSNVLDRAYVLSANGPAGFTNGLGHTIRGRGNIYYRMTNAGVVRGDVATEILQLRDGVVTNSGTIEAVLAGNVSFLNSTVNQTPGGQINASGGGVVALASTGISGGTLNATLPSRIQSASGTQTLNSTTINGPFDVLNSTNVVVATSLQHTGTLTVNLEGGGNVTSLRPESGAVFTGTGDIMLNATSESLDRAQLYAPSGSAGFVNASGHTIQGSGNIYYNFTNNGTIRSGLAGRTLQMTSGTAANNGLIQAVGGNVLVTSHTINQSSGGQVLATGGANVALQSSTLRGGTANATGGSRVVAASGANVVDTITLIGPFDVANAASVTVPTGLTNQSTITVNPSGGGNVTSFQPASGATLSGNGSLTLNASSNVYDRAQLYAPQAGPGFTNGAGHTINGSGALYYNVTNNGTIRADIPTRNLLIISGTVTNNSRMEATAGELILSSKTVTQSASGQVVATGGNVSLTSSTIQGGSVSGLSGSRVVTVSGQSTLEAITLAGRFDVENATSVLVPTSLTNNGVVTINPSGGGNATFLSLGNGATLGGSGSVFFNATSGVLDRAYLFVPAGSATNGPGHTIGGVGRMFGNLSNRGIVSPGNNSAGTIEHASGTFTQASDGVMNIELGGASAGQSDLFGGGGAKVLGGTLNISYRPGFQLGLCQTITIITGPSVTGRFATVNVPPVDLGFVSVIYNPTSVVISYVPSDYNGDGFPDFFDYDDFVNCFETGNCPEGTSADFNRDGFVDFFDYDAFVAAFESGC